MVHKQNNIEGQRIISIEPEGEQLESARRSSGIELQTNESIVVNQLVARVKEVEEQFEGCAA